MLELINISKEYLAGENKVDALKGVSISFRQNEFVSILGPSGCGKTTLLNIIGGLDRYSEGDLIIEGVSTKEYKDRDWDTYRNHEIGFVFQSYNLIPHLTVLGNVELALTLSGIGKAERKERACKALERVGLDDQLHKLPNQLSGGQMQRVAIARAIVNNPNIILADEPTGALDTETSLQVMEILKEISKDHLVIMVTHNPDLADKYSTRIIELLDGEIKSDSKPFVVSIDQHEAKSLLTTEKRNSKMSFATSLSLSFRNLLTKKGRTFMISFAGSIGIIGIALVLSISNGFTQYINNMQTDMLSGYPVTISRFAADYDAIQNAGSGMDPNEGKFPDDEQIHVYDPTSVMSEAVHLNLIDQAYTDYIRDFYTADLAKREDDRLLNSVQFSYANSMNLLSKQGDRYAFVNQAPSSSSGTSIMDMMSMFMGSNTNVFQEALDNDTFVQQQYDVIDGRYPTAANELAVVVDQRNRISVSTLSALGISYVNADGSTRSTIPFDEIIYHEDTQTGIEFRMISNDAYFLSQDDNNDGVVDYYLPAKAVYEPEGTTDDLATYYQTLNDDNSKALHVVGVLRLREDAPLDLFNSGILYLPSLTQEFIADAKTSKIVEMQNSNSTFMYGDYRSFYDGLEAELKGVITSLGGNAYKFPVDIMKIIFSSYVTPSSGISSAMLDAYVKESAKQNLGASDVPSTIYLYPKSFNAKEQINAYLDAWNLEEGHGGQKIVYTDAASVFSSTIGQMVDIVSYVLIAFTAISLIVSSIMIGIITYVSVIERTKEIGVLRSLGARKNDISSVFNSETLLIGLLAGIIGIVVTYVLCIPINIIIRHYAGAALAMNLAVFNPLHGLILIVISILLTLISGLIPSRIAAKKDPVIALRTE